MVDSSNIVFIIIAVIGGSFAMIAMGGGLQISDSAIPPTNAFDRINFDGVWYNATSFDDILTITSGGGGGGSTVDDLTIACSGNDKLNQLSLNNDTGAWAFNCDTDQTGAGGETNTASNVGSGVGVFDTKNGVDFEFNSLIAGTGISITDTTQDLTISATATAPLDMKSGSVAIVSSSWVTVTFNTAFSTIPICSATPINNDNSPADHKWVLFYDVATTGFDLTQKEKDGNTLTVMWICMVASDP